RVHPASVFMFVHLGAEKSNPVSRFPSCCDHCCLEIGFHFTGSAQHCNPSTVDEPTPIVVDPLEPSWNSSYLSVLAEDAKLPDPFQVCLVISAKVNVLHRSVGSDDFTEVVSKL